jgi:hypothetical protein
VEGVRENKERFAEAEARAAQKPQFPMPGFSGFPARTFIQRTDEDD